jgi:hypothetical protein
MYKSCIVLHIRTYGICAKGKEASLHSVDRLLCGLARLAQGNLITSDLKGVLEGQGIPCRHPVCESFGLVLQHVDHFKIMYRRCIALHFGNQNINSKRASTLSTFFCPFLDMVYCFIACSISFTWPYRAFGFTYCHLALCPRESLFLC